MNYKTAIKLIQSDRKNELLLYEQLFVNALAQNPQLRELEKEIYALKSAKNGGISVDEKKLGALQNQKQEYIKKAGLTPPPPKCNICGDTGLAGGKPCACVIKIAADSQETKYSFDDCDFSVFDPAELETVKTAYQKMHGFCDNFPTKNKLLALLFGKTGTGKTFLVSCVASALIEKGFSVVFCSAFDFVNRMLAYHTAPVAEKLEHIAPMLDCDLLIIDDLGTESMLKNVTVECLYNILNERLRLGRHTMITTNLDNEMLANRYGERVASRLFDKRLSMGFALASKDLRRR